MAAGWHNRALRQCLRPTPPEGKRVNDIRSQEYVYGGRATFDFGEWMTFPDEWHGASDALRVHDVSYRHPPGYADVMRFFPTLRPAVCCRSTHRFFRFGPCNMRCVGLGQGA